MLYQSDDLVLAHAKQRRQQLQDEAQAHRQARCIRTCRSAANRPVTPQPTLADRLFHAAGAQLVRWGTRLQQRSAARQVASATLVDTRPA
ncbi:MAG: hypothetical protein U0X20_15085 [Caldilineaceae bacterium]